MTHTPSPDIPPEPEPWVWVTSVPPCRAAAGPRGCRGRLWKARLSPHSALVPRAGSWLASVGRRRAGGSLEPRMDPDGQPVTCGLMSLPPSAGLSPHSASPDQALGACGVARRPFCHTGWAARLGSPAHSTSAWLLGDAERLISWARGGAGKTPKLIRAFLPIGSPLRVGGRPWPLSPSCVPGVAAAPDPTLGSDSTWFHAGASWDRRKGPRGSSLSHIITWAGRVPDVPPV